MLKEQMSFSREVDGSYWGEQNLC